MPSVNRSGLRVLAAIGIAATVALGAVSAQATHFRGGNIAWTPDVGNPNTITFTVDTYWRTSAFFVSNPTPGVSTISDPIGGLNFGDGNSATSAATVFTFFDTTGTSADWIGVRSTYTHTYGSTGNVTAFFNSCCRISTLKNAADDSFRLESLVTVGGGDSSANVGNSSPIFLVPDNGAGTMFNPFSLTDPDGGSHSFALATLAQSGMNNPLNLSIDSSTGVVTWDTDSTNGGNASPGDLFALAMLVTDAEGNTSPLDIILQVCTPGTQGCGAFQGVPPVPEPGSLAVLGFGLTGLVAVRRRRRKKA